MSHVSNLPAQVSLLWHFLQVLRNATLERMVVPDAGGKEIDECILLESHLVRTPLMLFAAQKAPFL